MIDDVGNYAYIFPTASLARKAAWQNIDTNGFKLLDHIPKPLISRKQDQQMFIELKNGSTLTFFGSDKQVSVGTNFKGIVLSEFALQDPEAYFYLRPVLLENKGFLIVASTPRGHNHYFDMWKMAQNNPEWFSQKLTYKECGVFTDKEIERERAEGMSDEMINSEYMCSFENSVEGCFFIKQMDTARLDERMGFVPWDPNCRVYTAWDLGMLDSTAIIFFQLIGNEIHVIDCFESSGEGLAYYAKILHSKPYIYDTHFAPHDINVRELGLGMSRIDTARSLGINFTALPTLKMSLDDGIDIARSIIRRCWFDAIKCKPLITALENYHREWDDKYKVFKSRPIHDKHSHYADAFRYAAIGIKQMGVVGSGYTDEDAQRMYKRYNPLF